jgi:uncharacterized protein YjbI with pentapeptide repeats
MEKDFDGNPITKDSREPDYGETREWQKKNPGTPVWRVKNAIRAAKNQALKEYKKNQRQAARRIPRGGNKFQGQDLSYGNFQNTKLNYADMKNADLTGADLSGASLSHADMKNADLTGANLSNARMSANLTGAKLTRAIMNGADLRGSNLEKALFGPDPSVADPSAHPTYNILQFENQKVNLKGAIFNWADLRNCWFVRAQASGSDFRKARLRRADFRGADLDRANFAYANLDGARGLNKVWKNGKLGSLKFIPDKKQPTTIGSPKSGTAHWRNQKKSWNYAAQLNSWILDENDNPLLPDHDKAIKAANRVSKTPAYGLMAEDTRLKWKEIWIVELANEDGMKDAEFFRSQADALEYSDWVLKQDTGMIPRDYLDYINDGQLLTLAEAKERFINEYMWDPDDEDDEDGETPVLYDFPGQEGPSDEEMKVLKKKWKDEWMGAEGSSARDYWTTNFPNFKWK